MSKKLTIEFIREEFEKEGYVLLTGVYLNNKQKLDYICPEGHVGTIKWNCWQRGHRCLECNGSKKLTIEFVREQFEKEGYILLTKEYINCEQKLEYICPNGHKNKTCWDSWKATRRCPTCVGVKKHAIEFIKKQFEKEGYILLTKKYINVSQKLYYICPNKHRGKISWDNWKAGKRCRKCWIENNKGSNNPRWNSNLTSMDRVSRRLIPKYTEWSYAVKEKDNFTCQVCGNNKGGNLVSHHIESYNNNPDLRIALNNGVCLCEKCHKKFHSMYGYGNNTRKQFEKFKNMEA